MSLSVNKLMSVLAVALTLVAVHADSSLPSVGESPPDFALRSDTGVNRRLSEYRGEVVLLNFWASWCQSCRAELLQLNGIVETIGSDVQVLSVNIDDNRAKAEQDLRALKLSFPVMFDTDQTVSKLYELPTLPVTLIIDQLGRLRFVHQGYKASDEIVYEDELASLLAE